MSAWPPVLLLLLLIEGIFTYHVHPLPPEYETSVLHVVRYLCAIAALVLLPGWPLSRLLLAGRTASPIKVLGLGLVISTLFHGVMIRSIRFLDIPLFPQELYWRVAVVTVAGLLAVWWVDRRHPLRVKRLLLLELGVGLLMVVVLTLFNPRQMLRPHHRCFSGDVFSRFEDYRALPDASLKVGSGFRPRGELRWSLNQGEGRLKIKRHGGQNDGAFPLRLVVMWTRLATTRVCLDRQGCVVGRIGAQKEVAGAAKFHGQPRINASAISLDVPAGVSNLSLRVTPAPTPDNPLILEDYSNVRRSRHRGLFSSRNQIGDLPMMGEAHDLMDHSWELPEFLLDHNDMLLGYLLYSVLDLKCGRSMVAANLFFLTSVLLCFLLVCELIRDACPGRSGLAFLFAALASLPVLLFVLGGVNYSYLPDVLYSAFLLIALMLLRAGHHRAFVLATIPAVLTRSTGVFVCTFMIFSVLLTDAPRRKMLRIGATCLLLWAATFLALTSQKLQSGDLRDSITFFLNYAKANDAATSFGSLKNAWAYSYNLLFHSSGLLLLVVLPRCRMGVSVLCVVALYSLMLMFSNYQPYYRFIPLVFFCAVGAGVNVLSLGAQQRRVAVPASVGLGFLVMVLMRLFA